MIGDLGRGLRLAAGVIGLGLLGGAGVAGAGAATGPLLDLADPVVLPGDRVQATVLGQPGDHYALAVSASREGLAVQGVELELGLDAVVVATGRLDGRGRAVVRFVPGLDEATGGVVYLQAITAASAGFREPAASPGKAVRSMAAWRARGVGPAGPAGPGPRGPAWPEGGLDTAVPGDLPGAPATRASGRGGSLQCPGCVTTAVLADGSVTAEKLAEHVVAGFAWSLTGNSDTDPAEHFLGTTDAQPFEVRVNDVRAWRLEPGGTADPFGPSPNVLGGEAGNEIGGEVAGAVIGGGGSPESLCGSPPRSCANRVLAHFGTVGGGSGNHVGPLTPPLLPFLGQFATVSGGIGNAATEVAATVAGGDNNTASGLWSTVAGGQNNLAAGMRSFAAGCGARVTGTGSFFWADSSNCSPGTVETSNGFFVQAAGGAQIRTVPAGTIPDAGVILFSGTSNWTTLSDRAAKTDVVPVDGRDVLRRLQGVPIATWRWKAQALPVRHMGPMAQDFHAAFGLGESDRHISTVDPDGVALAAIQALHQMVLELEAKTRALDALGAEVQALRRAVGSTGEAGP